MSTRNEAHRLRRFGEFSVDLDRGMLFRGDDEVHLRPKAFQVLTILLDNHGRLVPRGLVDSNLFVAPAASMSGSLRPPTRLKEPSPFHFQYLIKYGRSGLPSRRAIAGLRSGKTLSAKRSARYGEHTPKSSS